MNARNGSPLTVEYCELTRRDGSPYVRWVILWNNARISPLFKSEDDARDWLASYKQREAAFLDGLPSAKGAVQC